jgi:hypothetical protein
MAKAKPKTGSKTKPKGTTKALVIAVSALILLFAALPTATLLAIGLAPTLVAFVVDITPGRYLAKCVAGMNFAGVVPYLHNLWFTGHGLSSAIDIVTNVYALFLMYSAAGLGWLLFFGLPGAVAMFRALNAKRRIYALREKQKDLISEWGECILPAGAATEAGNSSAASSNNLSDGFADAMAEPAPFRQQFPNGG